MTEPPPGADAQSRSRRRLAWAVAGAVALALGGAVLLLPRLPVPRDGRAPPARSVPPLTAECARNLQRLAASARLYAADYDERLPPPDRWTDLLDPYFPGGKVLTCPAAPGLPSGYALYLPAAEVPLTGLTEPWRTPLFYDSSAARRNTADRLESFAPRHLGLGNLVFVDGHTRALPRPPP